MGNGNIKEKKQQKEERKEVQRKIKNKDDNKQNKENKDELRYETNNEDILEDIQSRQLRLKIVESIPLEFNKTTVIVLYAPPDFNLHPIATYISKRVNRPLIKPDECVKEVKTGPLFPTDTPKEREVVESQEDAIIQSINVRLQNSDCAKGFVIQSYPETIKQLLSLKKVLKRMKAKVVPFFFEIDSETMRTLRSKWDRWVAPSTGKSYHILTNPPKKMVETGNEKRSPQAEFMIDDDTGEQLVQLERDSPSYYQKKFQLYQLQEIPLYSHFAKHAVHITGCTSIDETQREVTRVLCNLVSKHTEYKSHAISTSHLCTDNSRQPFVQRVTEYIRQVSSGKFDSKQPNDDNKKINNNNCDENDNDDYDDDDDDNNNNEYKPTSKKGKQSNAKRFA